MKLHADRAHTDQEQTGRPRERGVALVIVLWVIVVLTLQVGLLTVQVRDGVHLVDNAAAAARGQALMHAAVEVVAARLTARDPRERWSADGGRRTLQIGVNDVVVSIHDENGRININSAEPPLIEGLLRQLAASPRDAQMLADRIADWRDPDQERRAKGAEARDYRRAGVEHSATDQPFLDTSDLLRVLDMPADLAARMLPHVTIHTAGGVINPRLASETVLRSLPGVSRENVDRALVLIQRGGETALAVDQELAAARPYLGTARGPAYRIHVGIGGNRRQATGGGEAVIAIGLDTAIPYRTLAWRFHPNAGAAIDQSRR